MFRAIFCILSALMGFAAVPASFVLAQPDDPPAITPPTVTRPSAGRIVIEGASYASLVPPGRVLEGEDVALAGIVHPTEELGRIVFDVDPLAGYTVLSAVVIDTTDDDPSTYDEPVRGWFEADLQPTRVDRIQTFIQRSAELERMRQDLGPMAFSDILLALAQIQREESAP